MEFPDRLEARRDALAEFWPGDHNLGVILALLTFVGRDRPLDPIAVSASSLLGASLTDKRVPKPPTSKSSFLDRLSRKWDDNLVRLTGRTSVEVIHAILIRLLSTSALDSSVLVDCENVIELVHDIIHRRDVDRRPRSSARFLRNASVSVAVLAATSNVHFLDSFFTCPIARGKVLHAKRVVDRLTARFRFSFYTRPFRSPLALREDGRKANAPGGAEHYSRPILRT
jgi:hypothetical protein